MKEVGYKLVKMAGFAGVVAVIMRFAGPWLSERIERMFDSASDEFPPKWMFVNISAIRENTERILEALDRGLSDVDTPAA